MSHWNEYRQKYRCDAWLRLQWVPNCSLKSSARLQINAQCLERGPEMKPLPSRTTTRKISSPIPLKGHVDLGHSPARTNQRHTDFSLILLD